MLVFALEYRTAIDAMSADKANKLRKFELSESEWKIVQQLCDVLKVSLSLSRGSLCFSPHHHVIPQVLKDATLFFSRSSSNLAMVIPAMDVIHKRFTAASINRNLDPAIQASIKTATKTLNRYYSLTDSSEVYRIAMSMVISQLSVLFLTSFALPVLHPRHKLHYFKEAGWSAEWIKTAEDLLRTEYARSYAPRVGDEDDEDIIMMDAETSPHETSVRF